MKLQLTDRFCQHAKAQGVQTNYFDETVSGLALRVGKGTKSWTLLYGTPRKRVTLGHYPSMSLASARTLALETKEGRTAGTVGALIEAYLSGGCRGKRTAKEIERRLRVDVSPVIGHISLPELHRRDVTRVLDAKAGSPIAARRVFEDVRAMLRWAVARGDLDHNPIEGLKGPANSKPRERTLTDEEIRSLWNGAGLSPNCHRVLKLCLVTAQRLGEVCGIQQSELDLGRAVWNIPGSRTKNRHPHSVPLSKLALEIIEEGIGGVKSLSVSKAVNGLQLGFTAHDLRRTCLTRMAELGVAPIVLGHIANHRTSTKAGITLGVYVHFAYEAEKRAALELWAERLQGIVSGSADVVPMVRR